MIRELPKLAVVGLIGAASHFSSHLAYLWGPDLSIFINQFDVVDERGRVSFLDSFDSEDFGGDLKIPLGVNFRSGGNATSPYGRFWEAP